MARRGPGPAESGLADDLPNVVPESCRIERLPKPRVEGASTLRQPFEGRPIARNDHDGYVAGPLVLTQGGGGLQAAHAGQVEIHDDDVRMVLGGQGDARRAIDSLDHAVTVVVEKRVQREACVQIVIDQEDCLR